MYIIIKSDEREEKEKEILQSYGYTQNASPEIKEYAEDMADGIGRALKVLEGKEKKAGNYEYLKLAIESMSGGSNTVILDDIGLPSIVVGMPKMYLSDLIEGAPHVVHPAWIVNGVEKDVIYVSKYINIVKENRAYSLPAKDPRVYVNYEEAINFCLNKGQGWHLLTNAMWAAISLWSKKNGTIPVGNTNNGENIYAPHEKGIPSSRYCDKVNRTATGTGPATWFHNHDVSGIADMTGNIWEWVSGLRLLNGEIQVIPDGNAASYDRDLHKIDSHLWHAITEEGVYSAHGEKNTLKLTSVSNGDNIEEDHLLGAPVIDTKIENYAFSDPDSTGNYGYYDCRFCDLKAKDDVKIPLIMKALALYPDHNDTKDGIFVVRNYGERIGVRGGKFDSFDRAGQFALHFYNPRYYHGGNVIGFRSAYVNLNGDKL